jgi:hypothetical protein
VETVIRRITVQDKTIESKIPKHITPILDTQLVKSKLHINNIEDDICYFCAINHTPLEHHHIVWVTQNICRQCEKNNPYIKQTVTDSLTFRSCQLAWWHSQVEGITYRPTEYMIEGAVSHAIDEFLTEYFSDSKNFEKFIQYYPSRSKIYQEILSLIQAKFDTIVSTIEEKSSDDEYYSVLKNDYLKMKSELLETVMHDHAYIATMRVLNNIRYQGDYSKIVAMKWVEHKVVGYFNYANTNIFLKGRIDKLYKLKENVFLIRDDKASRMLTMFATSTPHGYYVENGQFGGYSYLLKQYYKKDVSVIGVIWFYRYNDFIPVYCNEEIFLDNLKNICTFLSKESSPPIPRFQGGICSEKFCPYWKRDFG